MIPLIFILTLNFSCVEQKLREKESNQPESQSASITDTLTFSSGLRAIFQDSKGNYWFGSHREGVCRFDGKSFRYFTKNEGLSDNQVYSIQEDKNGIIWFDTQHGVSSFDGQSITNHTTTKNEPSQHHSPGTDHKAAQNAWMKTDKDLWFSAGTKEGIYRYDGENINYLAFPNPTGSPSGNVYSVTGFSKGKNNMLWISTYAGVFGYNGNQLTSINDETLGLTEESYKLHVRSILEDSKGRLWIGNNGIGVILKEGNAVTHFSREQGKLMPMNEFEANIRNNRFAENTGLQAVFAIEEDSQGNIWFGDRDTGAWKFDGKRLTNYIVDKSLKSQMIWSIFEDQNKNLLFGMANGGVYRYNGKSFERAF